MSQDSHSQTIPLRTLEPTSRELPVKGSEPMIGRYSLRGLGFTPIHSMTSAGGGRTGRPVASLAPGSKPAYTRSTVHTFQDLQDPSQLNSLLMRVSQDLVTKSLNTRAP
jgi:hypothetical protein